MVDRILAQADPIQSAYHHGVTIGGVVGGLAGVVLTVLAYVAFAEPRPLARPLPRPALVPPPRPLPTAAELLAAATTSVDEPAAPPASLVPAKPVRIRKKRPPAAKKRTSPS
jgi:hypothetical protein